MHKNLFTLEENRWYAWQMLPGYGSRPYFSPIFIHHIQPGKTGKRLLKIDFINALYAEGVKNFSMDMRMLKRSEKYLIAELIYGNESLDRSAVISEINSGWIKECCPCIQRFSLQSEEKFRRLMIRRLI
ncbi:MAG: hypothetical protein NTX50_01915 [Candidatus Sumerlaeota bacterium]|nr:hypothetical protein [Candidatus Sumerlaeota bacterium]